LPDATARLCPEHLVDGQGAVPVDVLDLVTGLGQQRVQLVRLTTIAVLEDDERVMPRQRLDATLQHPELFVLDVDLDEVRAVVRRELVIESTHPRP
jgi:hypothetical protein